MDHTTYKPIANYSVVIARRKLGHRKLTKLALEELICCNNDHCIVVDQVSVVPVDQGL